MKLPGLIENILKEQDNRFSPIPVDITISNGNILLRSFYIYSFDLENKLIQGLTQQEKYGYTREGRDPVYCFLKLDEVKELICPDLDLEYSARMRPAKV